MAASRRRKKQGKKQARQARYDNARQGDARQATVPRCYLAGRDKQRRPPTRPCLYVWSCLVDPTEGFNAGNMVQFATSQKQAGLAGLLGGAARRWRRYGWPPTYLPTLQNTFPCMDRCGRGVVCVCVIVTREAVTRNKQRTLDGTVGRLCCRRNDEHLRIGLARRRSCRSIETMLCVM